MAAALKGGALRVVVDSAGPAVGVPPVCAPRDAVHLFFTYKYCELEMQAGAGVARRRVPVPNCSFSAGVEMVIRELGLPYGGRSAPCSRARKERGWH